VGGVQRGRALGQVEALEDELALSRGFRPVRDDQQHQLDEGIAAAVGEGGQAALVERLGLGPRSSDLSCGSSSSPRTAWKVRGASP
jgi:hypothetical protein